MATNLEIQREQRRHLFTLLKLQKENNGQVKGLREAIIAAVSEMDEADVAWVEKNVAQL